MGADHTEYEYMFGDAACLILVSTFVSVTGRTEYRARPYVLGYRGRTMRAAGDREGRPLEVISESEEGALALASEYLEDRFGPCRAATEPTTSYVTSRIEEQPPVRDDRPEPVVVLAVERIRRGDEVIVTDDRARPAPRRHTRTPPGSILASAIEDIDKGSHGRVREIPKDAADSRT
jgi:hypothetical protein